MHSIGPRPFDQGVTEATLAANGVLRKPAPALVSLLPLPVTRKDVLHAWTTVYHVQPPAELVRAPQPSEV